MYTVFYSSETHDRYSDCRVSCTIASIAVTFSYVGTRMYNNNFTDISRCEGFYIVTVKLFYFKLCLSLKLHEKTWIFQTSIMLCRMHIRYRAIKTQGYNQQLLQHFKGYKPKVAVSKIYPVCFEALQSRKDLKNESDVLLLHVVICFKSPIGYNFTTDEILNLS